VRHDRQRRTRTNKIQKATAAANYMGDLDRATNVVNGATRAVAIGADYAAGNYADAVSDGMDLMMDSGREVFTQQATITKELKKINDWNDMHDEYGNPIDPRIQYYMLI